MITLLAKDRQTASLTNLSAVKFSSWGAYQAAKRMASNWKPLQRGAKAATSLRKQRELLDTARYYMKAGDLAMANEAYKEWKRERATYLVLVNFY